MCLGCKTCSALMSPGDKYSIKVSDEQMNGYKETFMMFDKVTRRVLNYCPLTLGMSRMETEQCPPRSWEQSSGL